MKRTVSLVTALGMFAALVFSSASGPNDFGRAGNVPVRLLVSAEDRMPLVMDVFSDPIQLAVKAAIERANQEQEQAFAQANPGLMQDTATSDYYAKLIQTNQDLKAAGVASIHLEATNWGPIRLEGANQAQATTFETWTTKYADGTIERSTDTNVYKAVQQDGAWRIASDAHPDSAVDLPFPSPGVQPSQPQPPSSGASSGGSLNWAGYAATGGTYSGVSATWTVPKLNAGSVRSADAAWVGIGGFKSRDLVQAGTQETVTGSGQVQYSAWVERLPQVSRTISLGVNAGDSVSVSISQSSPGQWQVDFKNNSTGQTYQESLAYNSSASSVEWVEEAPSSPRGVVPLDSFGTIQFTAATSTKDGHSANIAQAGGQPITMINPDGQALATPSPLGADGSSFSVTRTSNPSLARGSGVVTIPIGPGSVVVPLEGSGRFRRGEGGGSGF